MSSSDEDGPILGQKGQLGGHEPKPTASNEQMDEVYQKVNAALDLILRNKLEAHLLDCSLTRFVRRSFRLLSLGHWNTSVAKSEAQDAQARCLFQSRVELAYDLPLWHLMLEA